MKRTSRPRYVLALTVSAAAVAAPLALAPSAASAQTTDLTGPGAQKAAVTETGVFRPADSGADALTYDEELVPVGSSAAVVSVPDDVVGTVTILVVDGLRPEREYGAHVHVNPCGPTGDDAGSHFQDQVDPNQPSTDPEYANPENEIWLDFTTDADGVGAAVSLVPWTIGDRQAGSVVIHEHHTDTEPDHAGDAGERLACLTADLSEGAAQPSP